MNNEIYDNIVNILDEYKNKKDFSSILPAICEVIESSIDENMTSHGRWNGNAGDIGLFSGGSQRWSPLATSTKANYKSQGISNLERTLDRNAGGLRSSISIAPFNSTAVQLSVSSGSKKGANPKVYAAIHNFGGTITVPSHKRTLKLRWVKAGKAVFAKKNATGKNVYEKEVTVPTYSITIPPSPYLVLQDEDLEIIQDILLNFINT